MTTDKIGIAQILATLLASSALWDFIKSRVNRPKLAPEPSPPKTRIQKIGGWLLRRFRSPWELPLLGILFNGYVLFTELRRNTPVTRGVVLGIALSVALMVLCFLTMSLSLIWQAIGNLWESVTNKGERISSVYDHISSLYDLGRKQADVSNQQTDLLQQQAGLLHGQAVDLKTLAEVVNGQVQLANIQAVVLNRTVEVALEAPAIAKTEPDEPAQGPADPK